ncbi:MAG: DUF4248 domain-containing protein [Bacteroidaceae bacterium]|nr:hypothetical protein [Candidatus Minthousia equi]MCQ2246311.1 DUF4248 domain-containing protein [Bacteroidaceae bacterium]
MRSYTKSELAEMAGVSARTFTRWLSQHKLQLQQLGISPNAKIIPPVGVKYICDKYGISFD